MLDFSTNSDKRKTFILGYKIDNDSILVQLASGETYTVPNDKKNLDRLNELIQEQIDFSIDSNVPKYKTKDVYLGILDALCIPFDTYMIHNSSGTYQIIWKFCLGCAVLGTAFSALSFAQYMAKKSEKQKYIVFNNVKDELNEAITSDERLLDGISFKTENTIKCALQNGELPFKAINIDRFSKKDLLRIKANLKKSKVLDFPYVFVSDEQKKAVRLREKK